jgi:predicted O-methyltransferase YrrM
MFIAKAKNFLSKFTSFGRLYLIFFNRIFKLFSMTRPNKKKNEHKLKNEKSIISIYRGMLYREPEKGAIEHWLAYVENGHTLDDILDNVLESEEFQGIKKNNLNKLYVPPGHFYSPIVDPMQLENYYKENVKHKPYEELPGIKIDKHAMLDLWKKLQPFLKTTPFTEEKVSFNRYYFQNPAFSFGDGAILSAILRNFKPKNIIEIGSGYSSACTLDTVDQFLNSEVNVTFIEPYPELLLKLIGVKSNSNIKLIDKAVQAVDLELFSCLKKNDILFIDSTHLIKTGSDVCHELFKILPSLNRGVIIHFHDVFWPFEYPKDWVLLENRSWNEIYGLRAFLMNNKKYEILFFNDFFGQYFRDAIAKDYPDMLKNIGGSLWLIKK